MLSRGATLENWRPNSFCSSESFLVYVSHSPPRLHRAIFPRSLYQSAFHSGEILALKIARTIAERRLASQKSCLHNARPPRSYQTPSESKILPGSLPWLAPKLSPCVRPVGYENATVRSESTISGVKHLRIVGRASANKTFRDRTFPQIECSWVNVFESNWSRKATLNRKMGW